MDCLQKKLQEMEKRNPSPSLQNIESKPNLTERIGFFLRDHFNRVSRTPIREQSWKEYMYREEYQSFHPVRLTGYLISMEDVSRFISFMDKYGIEPRFGEKIDRQEMWINRLRDMHEQLGIYETEEELRESTKEKEGKKAIEVFVRNFDPEAIWYYDMSKYYAHRAEDHYGKSYYENYEYKDESGKFGFLEVIHSPWLEKRFNKLFQKKEESDFTIDTSGYDGWLNSE